MSINKFYEEASSPVSAERMFKAAILDVHNLGPKLMPEVVVSGAIVEGDGGVGTVKKYTFTNVVPFTYVKEQTDLLDKENLEFQYTVVEGGYIGKKLEYVKNHVKYEPTANGGCLCKVTGEYKTLAGEDAEEEMKGVKEGIVGLFKAIEGYHIEPSHTCELSNTIRVTVQPLNHHTFNMLDIIN